MNDWLVESELTDVDAAMNNTNRLTVRRKSRQIWRRRRLGRELKYHQSAISFIRLLTTWHCSQLLACAVLLGGRRCRSIYPPAGRPAANPPHAAAAVDRWDRLTDGQTEGRRTVT